MEIDSKNEEIPLNMPSVTNYELVRWQITAEDIIFEIEKALGGYEWDFEKQQFVKKRKPIINEIGLDELKPILYVNLGKLTNLNKFRDEEEIREITCMVWRIIRNALFLNYRKWGIDKENLSTIRSVIVNSIYYSLKKSHEAKFLEYLKPSIKRTETINTTQQNSGVGGFLNTMNPFK